MYTLGVLANRLRNYGTGPIDVILMLDIDSAVLNDPDERDDEVLLMFVLSRPDLFTVRGLYAGAPDGNTDGYTPFLNAYGDDYAAISAVYPSAPTKAELEAMVVQGPNQDTPSRGYYESGDGADYTAAEAVRTHLAGVLSTVNPSTAGNSVTNPRGKLHILNGGGFSNLAHWCKRFVSDGIDPDFLKKIVVTGQNKHNSWKTENAWTYIWSNCYRSEGVPGLFGDMDFRMPSWLQYCLNKGLSPTTTDANDEAIVDALESYGNIGAAWAAERAAGTYTSKYLRGGDAWLAMHWAGCFLLEEAGTPDPFNPANANNIMGPLQLYDDGGGFPWNNGVGPFNTNGGYPTGSDTNPLYSPTVWCCAVDITSTAEAVAEVDLVNDIYPLLDSSISVFEPRVAPTITGASITGTPEDTEVLTANHTITGFPTPTVTYQWQKNGTNISGQTSKTITLDESGMSLSPEDVISCEITATNSEGSDSIEPTVEYELTNLNDYINGEWLFTEGSGASVADSMGNGLTGSLDNSPSWTTGGVNFASTDQRMIVSDDALLDNSGQCAWIVVCKFNALSGGSEQALMVRENSSPAQFQFRWDTVDLGGGYRSNGGTDTFSPVGAGTVGTTSWHVVTFIKKSDDTLEMRLDNASIGTASITGTPNDDVSSDLYIGGSHVGSRVSNAIIGYAAIAPDIPTDTTTIEALEARAVQAMLDNHSIEVYEPVAPTLSSTSITGTPEDAEILTANYSVDGYPTPTVTFQWQNNGTNISGETGQTITLDESGMSLTPGDTISCEITATNSEGSDSAEPTIEYDAINLDDYISGEWLFTEGSGTSVADATGNGLTGTLNSSPPWVTGGVNFSGSGDRMVVSDNALLDNSGQCAWIVVCNFNALSGSTEQALMLRELNNNERQFQLRWDTSKVNAGYRSNYPTNDFNTVGNASPGTGTWRVFTLVKNGTALDLRMDGTSVGTATISGTPNDNVSSALYVGGSYNDARYANAIIGYAAIAPGIPTDTTTIEELEARAIQAMSDNHGITI